ncbi:hypothetical protein MYRNA_47 [Mycobacterium phage Myrna]|uniref:Uncharacterized protein n=1 Tax=Mycobacterium phage Myrna TaxID=546805 RepID=B5LJ58_9CAUD|nr:gp47 [Mycobacterium phage Myrna]ACH62055.1 hypothetical protein MYRNA_47 [Mycobacterium phage Myrna]
MPAVLGGSAVKTGIDAIREQIERVTPSWLWDQVDQAIGYVPIRRQEPPKEPDPRSGVKFTIVCGCGSPAFAWYDEDGVYHIESHSDYVMGSDVPCYGTWY